MLTLRTASFWMVALILPGGLLLLAPQVVRLAKMVRAMHSVLPPAGAK